MPQVWEGWDPPKVMTRALDGPSSRCKQLYNPQEGMSFPLSWPGTTAQVEDTGLLNLLFLASTRAPHSHTSNFPQFSVYRQERQEIKGSDVP